MKLSYRGVSYEQTQPSLEMRESEILAQHQNAYQRCQTLRETGHQMSYRGVKYTTDQMAAVLAPTPARSNSRILTFRGVQYTKAPNGTVQLVDRTGSVAIPATAKISDRDLSRVHQENLRRNLERRLQSAHANGDQTLINLLEAESRELAL